MIPDRLLLGSGPSLVPPVVLEAMAQPTIGHMDPAFVEIMGETCELLRETFRTTNRATLPLSATGSGGMDATVANFVERGDRVAVGVCGLFGQRLAEAVVRAGAQVDPIEGEWGRAIEPERLLAALERGAKTLVVVHGETSTGVLQPLDGIGAACRERDALLIVDCVTSLAGDPVEIDEWQVDVAFSGTQKCLNCPPGLSPFTVGERAIERLGRRAAPGRSWYFDLSLLLGYWDGAAARAYHHTAPINLVYALHAALALVQAEGLKARWERHAVAHESLRRELAERHGLERLAPDGEALHPLLCVKLPEPIAAHEVELRRALLLEHGIEISGGLGPLAGKVWRIGVMGEGARPEVQDRLLAALAAILPS